MTQLSQKYHSKREIVHWATNIDVNCFPTSGSLLSLDIKEE
jgi:hypothetical protein